MPYDVDSKQGTSQMIPLKDDTPRLSTPLLNYFLIAANVVVFLFQSSLDRSLQAEFINTFSLVPARLLAAVFHGYSQHGYAPSAGYAFLTIVTSMFLHGNIWHLVFNMWFLWVFGRNLEDALGHFPYLIFYLACGVAAAFAQVVSDSTSLIPMLGASGAIAGVMGGYFVLYPRARVLMLVPFLFIFFLWLPAWVVLGYWFVLQFLSGVGTSLLAAGNNSGGVAFWAHVGGFVAGVFLVRLFPSRARRYRYNG
jgi:membrane associated rhomboid family serine protease